MQLTEKKDATAKTDSHSEQIAQLAQEMRLLIVQQEHQKQLHAQEIEALKQHFSNEIEKLKLRLLIEIERNRQLPPPNDKRELP